jgi:glycogen phosphorylase
MERYGLSFAEAREVACAGLVFTTHTPVPAGHDYFSTGLLDRYLGDYARGLGLSRQEFYGLGRQNPANDSEEFCMTVLALRMAASSNGVSQLHGAVSRKMWKTLWPGVPEDEIPIGSVTNGVHFRSWISAEMNQLYDRYLSPKWREERADKQLWKRAETIPAEELWRTHERRRERLVGFAPAPIRVQLERRGAPQAEIDGADEALDPDALTIGFARRFATYKRATLLLRDPDRLARILNDPQRPVQIVFAGKAHPRDDAGKVLIQQIVKLAQRSRVPPPGGLPGELRPGRGPLPGAGLRRLAEYAAAAGRSQRHQRHEGPRQRRIEPQHPGRLVGRSLAPGRGPALRRLGHRPRREVRQPGLSGPGGIAGAL